MIQTSFTTKEAPATTGAERSGAQRLTQKATALERNTAIF
jgi:hypothetical protein